MKRQLLLIAACIALLTSCSRDDDNTPAQPDVPDTSSRVVPLDVNTEGIDLLSKMQGHWTGSIRIIATDYEWFAFDYRAISESHVFGIHEGGTMGNLFTSFFVTDYKDTRTIMARNGGLLNGIYRTSYFVLDSASHGNDGDFYRLVDAVGGTNIMWMELRFVQDSLYFNAYTSRLGLLSPTRHMTFRATREHPFLAQEAANETGFPQNTQAWDFDARFVPANLYTNAGEDEAKSATYIDQKEGEGVYSLAFTSGDPIRIEEHPYLSTVNLNVVRQSAIQGKPLIIYLSIDPLTDGSGLFQPAAFNSILHFPEIIGTQNEFLFTYLHPGDYYLTVVADMNEDGVVSAGDITSLSAPLTVAPTSHQEITVNNITFQN